MPVKTSVSRVVQLTAGVVQRDVKAAAGGNGLLSLDEQKRAPAYIRDAAQALRAAGGPRARVTVDALETSLTSRAVGLISSVDQRAGSGAGTLSRREAEAAAAKDPLLGPTVLAAYQVAAGKGVNVDSIAEARVNTGLDDETVFKTFASEADAMNYRDPQGRHVAWLVPVADGLLQKSYVSGRNDLWSQRFEVDRITGAVAVTGEH